MANAATGLHHELDDDLLGQYLSRIGTIPGLRAPVLTKKIGYGQSNPTYFLDDAAGTRFILRKKPQGENISPVAHQIDREFKVLQALGSVEGFPVPKVYDLCMDTSILGTPFYVMEFVKGRIITDPEMKDLSPADRRQVWFSAIENLAWLHSLDSAAIGLDGYGKKTDFYARHCRTWSLIEAQQSAVIDQKTGKSLGRAHPKYDEVIEFIKNHLPGNRHSIVHGDFKFDNLIIHPTEPRVIAILDWELSTIGHPLMDLVFSLSPFLSDYIQNETTEIDANSWPYSPENRSKSGMPDPNELIDRYSQVVGFDMRKDGGGRDWEVATIFHHLRSATIAHGIHARAIRGQASSSFSHQYFSRAKRSMDAAYKRVKTLDDAKGKGYKL